MTSTQHESKVLLVSTKGKNEREEMEETKRRRRNSGQHWRNSGWTYRSTDHVDFRLQCLELESES